MTETRLERITRERAERDARREAEAARPRRNTPKHRRKSAHRTAEERAADIIDGYNRDDLGESPDF